MRLNKVSARVFCTLNGGKRSGNPVTIFASSQGIPIGTQTKLAQQCEWESVMVNTSNATLAFYMPTGEQVNFCAHAAMGGVTQLKHTLEKPLHFSSAMRLPTTTQQNNDADDTDNPQSTATIHDNNIVSLELRETWETSKIKHPPSLHRLLREACGVEASSLVPPPHEEGSFPTFCNSSTARPKTLVYVNSLQALHQARAPTNATVFQRACDNLETTGLYLYTPQPDEMHAFECRQFPRASYPEDPATGIAASALAVALQQQAEPSTRADAYKFYQGTSMGRPSLILVENLHFHSDQQKVSFRLLGQVQIDDQEEIEEDCTAA